MATTARSIDAAASGYIRHRFVRAFAASSLVAVVFGATATVIAAAGYSILSGDLEQLAVLPLGILLAALAILPVWLGATLFGALADALPRRVTGLLLLALALLMIVYGGAGAVAAIVTLAGDDVLSTSEMQVAPIEAAGLAVYGLVGALVGYEFLRHAWWQITARAADFFAVRGWRPPLWRLITTFRRHLGLPAFLSHVGRRRLAVTLLYFGVAVLNLGLLMLIVLPMLISSGVAQEGAVAVAMIVGAAALLLLNLFGVGALLSRHADTRATALYQNVREWDARAPIVFLRAFDQDKAKLRAVGGDLFARWPAGVGRPRTLDEILLEHASPYGPVIAIGDPRDPTPPLGAARVFVPDAGTGWQDVVRGLAAASKAVVMCPNHGEGVQWELDLIAQAGGRLQTIFLASPELDREAMLALLRRVVPELPEVAEKQIPVAAWRRDGEWSVLTARRLSVESCTAALNAALQALFGQEGEAVKRPA